MRLVTEATREKELAARWPAIAKPITDRRPGLLGDLELDRPVGFPLNNSSTVANMPSHAYVGDPESHKVTTAQLAIDREIEQGKIAAMVFELESDPDRPDLLWFERALRPMRRPLFQGAFAKPTIDGIAVGMICSLIPTAPPQRRSRTKPQLDKGRSRQTNLSLRSYCICRLKVPHFRPSHR